MTCIFDDFAISVAVAIARGQNDDFLDHLHWSCHFARRLVGLLRGRLQTDMVNGGLEAVLYEMPRTTK